MSVASQDIRHFEFSHDCDAAKVCKRDPRLVGEALSELKGPQKSRLCYRLDPDECRPQQAFTVMLSFFVWAAPKQKRECLVQYEIGGNDLARPNTKLLVTRNGLRMERIFRIGQDEPAPRVHENLQA